MSKDNKPNYDKDDTSLDFKLHQDFFELLFTYIRNYEEAMADFYTDPKSGIKAFKEIVKLISFTSPHISKKADIEKIKKKRDNISKEIKEDKMQKARVSMESLAEEIFNIFERSELIPKIKHEEDENSKFWRDEEHKGLREVKKGFYDVLMLE